MAVARLRLTVMKRQVTTVSSKMGATRNVVGWRVVTAAYVLHCHLLLRPERRYRQLPASPRQETARKIATKRRDEHLESGLIPRDYRARAARAQHYALPISLMVPTLQKRPRCLEAPQREVRC